MEKIQSAMYKVEELKNNMVSGIHNATEVREQQNELAEILKKAKNTKTNFTSLIKSIGETSEDLTNQVNIMSIRLACLNDILDVYNKGFKEDASEEDKFKAKFLDEMITKCLYSFGIVKDNEMDIKEEN